MNNQPQFNTKRHHGPTTRQKQAFTPKPRRAIKEVAKITAAIIITAIITALALWGAFHALNFASWAFWLLFAFAKTIIIVNAPAFIVLGGFYGGRWIYRNA